MSHLLNIKINVKTLLRVITNNTTLLNIKSYPLNKFLIHLDDPDDHPLAPSHLSATIWPLESTTVTTLGLSMK